MDFPIQYLVRKTYAGRINQSNDSLMSGVKKMAIIYLINPMLIIRFEESHANFIPARRMKQNGDKI